MASATPKRRSRLSPPNTPSRTAPTTTATCSSGRGSRPTISRRRSRTRRRPRPANGGAAPPDFSLLAKARGVERGFPTFIFDIFTQYAENGPDYIHSLLTGYGQEPPAGMEIPEGTHYNPYFNAGKSLEMSPPLTADAPVKYDDGTPESVEQNARDVTAFLMWAAEPHLEDRKKTGFRVVIFLVLFGALVYLTKRKIWADVAH